MSKFEHHVLSKRFLDIVDDLISRKIVRSQADFCKQMGYGVQSMSQIRVGKRNVTIDLISKLYDVFRGNPIYLLTGNGYKILDNETLSIVQEPKIKYGKSEVASIDTYEKLVKSKDEVIDLLKEKVERLENELGVMKKQKN